MWFDGGMWRIFTTRRWRGRIKHKKAASMWKPPVYANELYLFAEFRFQRCVQLSQELFGVEVMFAMLHFVAMDTNSQVLRHFTAFNGFNANLLQRMAEIHQLLVAVQLATELQAARPC